MRVSVDDALEGGQHAQVEAIVKAVTAKLPESEHLLVSVVRVKPGTWHVFIRDESPGQWSVLPSTSHQPLVQAIERAIRHAGI